MNHRSDPCPQTIQSMCESIKSRWDVKTTANRRLSAVARQRKLARRLGFRLQANGEANSTIKSYVA